MNVKNTSIIFGIVFIVSLSILIIALPKKTISSEDINSVKVKSELLESGIQIDSENKEADLFTSTIEYPQTQIEEIDMLFVQWINEEEDKFYEQLEQTSYFFGKKQIAHLTIKSDISKVNKNIFSFKMTSEQYIKDNIHTDRMKTFVIDLKNKEIINIENVLDLNEKNIELLTEYIVQTNTTKTITNEMIKDKFSNIDKTDWILTKDEFILYFHETIDGNPGYSIYTSRLNNESIKKVFSKKYKYIVFPELKKEKEKKSKKKKKKPKKKAKKDLSDKKVIALTFDDGPDANITPQVLKTLEKHDVTATFFVLSNNAQRNPDIAKQIVKKGHEIANHSKTHINLNAAKKSRFKTEIIQSQKEIETVTGVKPTLFRPPYGEYNQAVIDLAKKSKQEIIMWSVDTYDWKSLNKKKILNEVKRQTNNHSIILTHDIHQPTADSLDDIIKYLKKSGFEFVTVTELLTQIKPMENGVYYGK